MCSSRWACRILALGVTLAAACGGGDARVAAPTVLKLEPACGDNSTTTAVTASGTFPVAPEVWVSDPARSQVDATYRAWLGAVELTGVTWTDPTRLAAVVPAGLAVGSHDLTVQGPAGATGTLAAAFQARAGSCPVETAALVLASPLATPATATVGQDLTVTVTVQNSGLAPALDVLPSIAAAPAAVTFKSGPGAAQDIPGGQARTFTWIYAATAPGGGVFVVDAAGTAGDTGLPVSAARLNTNEVLVSLGTFLTANTVVAPRQATVGQLVTAALTVTNHTTAAVLATPSVVVTGPVTAGHAPAAQSIPGGSSTVFQWTFTASAPGTASFTAAVAAFNPGTGAEVSIPTAAVDVTVQDAPGLTATLSAPPAVELGGFTVTMLVSHSGGAAAAAVVDVVPDPPAARAGSTATVVLASGPTGAPATVAAGQPAVSFTWTFTATAPGTLSLTAAARGRDANTGGPVVSAPAESGPVQVALHSIGGAITGLVGTGLVLADNGVPGPAIAAGATSYVFPALVGSGGAYDVTVAAQPANPSQTCTVARASGTVGAADVTDVAVTCTTNSYAVGGTVGGLTGLGLVLNDGTEDLSVPAGATSFAFPTRIASGGAYAVTVTTQPSGPTQTCSVANPSGTIGAADVTDVVVTCSRRSFTIGGTVTGLVGAGLLLTNNAAESLPVTANGPFAFPTPVASGATYAVTVSTQPTDPSQICTVANATGTVGAADVTDVAVTCATSSFTVGGTVSGLAGTGLVLRNRTENLSVAANGTFTFSSALASGTAYDVTVRTEPSDPTQTCTVLNGSGTVGAADVTDVDVTCTTSAFTVGGAVSGLAGTGLVLANNGVPGPAVPAGATRYAFPTAVPSGAAYAVTVSTQPTDPSQTCTVANATGTVGAADVTDADVTCTTSRFTVGGTVSGLAGTGLVLRNGTENLPVTANGAFTFSSALASGTAYDVTVRTEPSDPSQTCTVLNGSGTVGGADVTSVAVTCATSTFTVGGTITGLTGAGLVLSNAGEALAVPPQGGATIPFTFGASVASGETYAVSVAAQPEGQLCLVSGGADLLGGGTIGSADVTSILVGCAP